MNEPGVPGIDCGEVQLVNPLPTDGKPIQRIQEILDLRPNPSPMGFHQQPKDERIFTMDDGGAAVYPVNPVILSKASSVISVSSVVSGKSVSSA